MRSRSTGIQDHELLEIFALEASIPAEQPIGLRECVSADQEVSDNARARTTPAAILAPSGTCSERRVQIHRRKSNADPVHGIVSSLHRWKSRGNFRPNDLGRDQATFGFALAERRQGSLHEYGIFAEHIQKHVGVNGGDLCNRSLRSPRNSSMISSVDFPESRMPITLSQGSWVVRLVITNRPWSSRTSSTCPGRIPNRSRSALGMVIWPFSETMVFILIKYEFIPDPPIIDQAEPLVLW